MEKYVLIFGNVIEVLIRGLILKKMLWNNECEADARS